MTVIPTGSGGAARSTGRRSAVLGITALVLAVLLVLSLPVSAFVVNLPAFIDQASTITGALVPVQFLGLLVAAVLALVAVLTDRGRWWGVTALALVVLSALAAALPIVLSLLPGAESTPVR